MNGLSWVISFHAFMGDRSLLSLPLATLVLESRCSVCFRYFPAPAHLVQMNGLLSSSVEAG